MFEEWGFLLTEIWVLLLLAALLGLFAGWLIFGRSGDVNVEGNSAELDTLRADLKRCRDQHGVKDAKIKGLEADLASAKVTPVAVAAPVVAAPAVADEAGNIDYDGDGVIEGKDEGTKPKTLTEARAGGADDLKRIKGIGPKMEKLCNTLGFYHFDQIAAWNDQEVAWVDANLEGFKGRVTRDTWVDQAKLLAAGGETEFSQKVDKGDVY